MVPVTLVAAVGGGGLGRGRVGGTGGQIGELALVRAEDGAGELAGAVGFARLGLGLGLGPALGLRGRVRAGWDPELGLGASLLMLWVLWRAGLSGRWRIDILCRWGTGKNVQLRRRVGGGGVLAWNRGQGGD